MIAQLSLASLAILLGIYIIFFPSQKPPTPTPISKSYQLGCYLVDRQTTQHSQIENDLYSIESDYNRSLRVNKFNP